jgi:hypothetical protein
LTERTQRALLARKQRGAGRAAPSEPALLGSGVSAHPAMAARPIAAVIAAQAEALAIGNLLIGVGNRLRRRAPCSPDNATGAGGVSG